MIKEEERYYSYVILTFDYIAILLAYAIAAPLSGWVVALIRRDILPWFSTTPFTEVLYFHWFQYYDFLLPMLLFPLIALQLSDSYRLTKIYTARDIFKETSALFLSSGALLALFFVTNSPYLEKLAMILMAVLVVWVLFVINRLVIAVYLKILTRHPDILNHLLIIGTGRRAVQTAVTFSSHPEWPISVVGFLSNAPEEVGKNIEGFPVLGVIDDLPKVMTDIVVDSVLVSETVREVAAMRQIAALCALAGVDFTLNSSLMTGKASAPFVEKYDRITMLVYKFVNPAPFNLFAKRLLDLAASATAIVMLLPLWIIMPVLIRMDSPGPALFAQERVGKNGRRFKMFKFRSMVQDAERLKASLAQLNEMDGPVFKIKADPRITKMGRFIRKTSIDELPQLFNVFLGDMSLVGPRPPIPSEVAQYGLWQKKRLSVKPGITCLWQISGRNEIKFDEWMRLDRQYIDNWSLALDMKILFKTVFVVFSRKGAE
jgi:exopolysaccharide biosynthesis polyprenyl glycosylphosphotransferase